MVMSEFFWLLFALKTPFQPFYKNKPAQKRGKFSSFLGWFVGKFLVNGVVSNPYSGFEKPESLAISALSGEPRFYLVVCGDSFSTNPPQFAQCLRVEFSTHLFRKAHDY